MAQPAVREPGAKVDVVVYASPEHYASFPTVYRTEREIVLVYPVQELGKLRATGEHPHYQRASVPEWAVSRDGGYSWERSSQSPPVSKFLHATGGNVALGDGGLLTLSFGAQAQHALIQHGTVGGGGWTGSLPRGVERHQITDLGPYGSFHVHSVVRTSDGALLAAGYAVYNPAGSARQKETVVFLQSADEGRSWGYLSHIAGSVPQLP